MEELIYSKGDRVERVPFVSKDYDSVYTELCKHFVEKPMLKLFQKIFADKKPRKFVLISGKSAFEQFDSFYKTLLDLLINKWVDKEEKLELIIFLEYFNSGTSKALITIFLSVFSVFKERCHVLWLCYEDDDDGIAAGEELMEIADQSPETFLVTCLPSL